MASTGSLAMPCRLVVAGRRGPVAGSMQPLRGRRLAVRVANVAAPLSPTSQDTPRFEGGQKLANPPPFTLQDIRDAIPAHCFEKDVLRSSAHLALDVGVVIGLAYAAYHIDSPLVWPFYWLAQGTMFWALFVVGHDCGHQSFSNNKDLNDLVGNITHASILVPYHGWRISHRKHHANHGHVENDESWHPMSETDYKNLPFLPKLGRLLFPAPLFAYPFYLFQHGMGGSHYDPKSALFTESEGPLVESTNKFLCLQMGLLAGLTLTLGPLAMINLYFLPYWVFIMWLDLVTYLHHHGPSDDGEQVPWYRGEEWNYMRGGLSTIDRDYGIINKIHHDIGTHVVHHLFPQIPHYHLCEATEAVKPVLGPYYREPEPSPGWFPTHLIEPLVRSFNRDHYVADKGDIVFYERDPELKNGTNFFK